MEKTGAPWIARTAASVANYGKGKAKQIIKADNAANPTELEIVTEGARTITTKIKLNGEPGSSDTPLGAATCTATVTDGVLNIEAVAADGKVVKMSHKMESENVRLQEMSLDGVSAWRRWTRQ